MSMITHRENLLSVITGETVERLPWVLRIDLWYNAQETRGTNSARFEGMVVEDIHRRRSTAASRKHCCWKSSRPGRILRRSWMSC